MTEQGKLPVGQFVKEHLDAAKRRVSQSGNNAGLAGIYPDAARAVLSTYPELTAAEKQTVFGTLKDDAELTKVRIGSDVSMAGLGETARILGVSR